MSKAKRPSPAFDAPPPHDAEAEAGALGCLLSGQDGQAESLMAELSLDHFYYERHRTIFRALVCLKIDRKRLDLVAVAQWLRDKQQMEEAGGFGYLSALPDQTPSPANFPTFLETLQDRALRRAVVHDTSEVAAIAHDTSTPLHVVAGAARRIAGAYAGAAKAAGKLPPIDNAALLVADEQVRLPPEIIEGVLHCGLKGVLGSNSKARKTWILLDAALSVATGLPFWKWRTHRGRVLYINFEIPRAFIRSRIKRLCERREISDVSNLDVWTLRGHGAALGQLLPDLLAKIEAGKYLLIIVDPIYKVLGGRDENSAGDIGELCNELEQIAVGTGAAILYAAHFSKGNQAGKEAIDRIGGSGVWGRDADSIVTLTEHKQEGAYTVDLTLRNLPVHPPFCVRWEFPLMHVDNDLDPAKLKQANGGRVKEHDPKKLLAVIADTNPERPISVSAWARLAEIGRTTLADYLPEMRRKGWISTVGEGSTARQHITPQGREALKSKQ